jgi:hypothetical protein
MKSICVFAAHLAKRYQSDTTHDKVRAVCAYAYAQLLHIWDLADRWLDAQEVADSLFYGRVFLQSYGFLGAEATRLGTVIWKIRPKHHFIDEMLERIRETHMNPRHQHCFMEEDFAGKLSRLARKCHRLTVCVRSIERYLLFITIRWGERRNCDRWMVVA